MFICFLHVHLGIHECVCVHAGQKSTSNVLLSQFSSLFVSKRLLLNLELTGLARSRDPPVLPPWYGGSRHHHHTWVFTEVLGVHTHAPVTTKEPLEQLSHLPSPTIHFNGDQDGCVVAAYVTVRTLRDQLVLSFRNLVEPAACSELANWSSILTCHLSVCLWALGPNSNPSPFIAGTLDTEMSPQPSWQLSVTLWYLLVAHTKPSPHHRSLPPSALSGTIYKALIPSQKPFLPVSVTNWRG